MYYIKKNNEKIYINDENTYCNCPICGREEQIDLNFAIHDDVIMFDSNIFCDSCTEHGYTEKYVKAKNNGTWDPDNALYLVEDEKIRRHLIEDGFRVYVCPVTGTLQIINDDGTEGSLALYIALLRRNDRI